MKRRGFIQAVVAAGLGSRVTAAENQTPSMSRGNPAIGRQLLGKTGVEVSILALGGVAGSLVCWRAMVQAVECRTQHRR